MNNETIKTQTSRKRLRSDRAVLGAGTAQATGVSALNGDAETAPEVERGATIARRANQRLAMAADEAGSSRPEAQEALDGDRDKDDQAACPHTSPSCEAPRSARPRRGSRSGRSREHARRVPRQTPTEHPGRVGDAFRTPKNLYYKFIIYLKISLTLLYKFYFLIYKHLIIKFLNSLSISISNS